VSAVLPVYNRSDLLFHRGEGVYLFTPDDERYLDFAAGIAVNSLGHSHPHLVKELTDQVHNLWHTSNMYQIEGLEEYAKRLTDACFADFAFFCNSGGEAVEAGLKMIRKYHDENGNPDKFRVITFEGCFHGRTLAGISAAKKDKLLKGFEPEMDGFDQVPFEDIEAVKEAITPETGGVLLEPIIGEGGIKAVSDEFLQDLRKICDEYGLLLMLDEIQCGMGRTGKLFAYEWSGIKPDIVATAKGIGSGFPLAATLCTKEVAKAMNVGCHGSTYGSNPLAIRVGNAVLDILLEDGFIDNVIELEQYFKEKLEELKSGFPSVVDSVRGKGLMLGLKLKTDSIAFVNKLREKKLLTAPAAEEVVRILPPLIITKENIDEAVSIIKSVCEEY